MLFRSRNEVHSRFSPSTPVPAFEQSKPSSSSGKAGKSGDSSFLKQIHQLKNCINILTKCKLTILPRQLLQTIIYTSPHEKSATWNTIFDQKSPFTTLLAGNASSKVKIIIRTSYSPCSTARATMRCLDSAVLPN